VQADITTTYLYLWKTISRTNGLSSTLSIENEKYVTSSIGIVQSNKDYIKMWCHYRDKNNHFTDDCREISNAKQQKKAHFEAKAASGKIVGIPL
jgi:hypothetical protein